MNRITTIMKQTLPEVAGVTALSSISFSWLEAATQVSMALSAFVGIIVGLVAIWWNVERALAARKERINGTSRKK